jgi:acyl dehydratase
LNEPVISVWSVSPLLAAVVVGATKTANEDFEVAEPALQAAIAAIANAAASRAAVRFISPPLPGERLRTRIPLRRVGQF